MATLIWSGGMQRAAGSGLHGNMRTRGFGVALLRRVTPHPASGQRIVSDTRGADTGAGRNRGCSAGPAEASIGSLKELLDGLE